MSVFADLAHRLAIEAGTPPQTFQLLPAIQAQNLLLPVADECVKIQPNSTSCGSSRGAYPFAQRFSPGFQHNQSSTWETVGLYQLGLEADLGFGGNGLNGFDTVRLENIKMDHFPVTAYASPKLWIGQLGLSPSPLKFSDSINSPSLLSGLKDGGHIPSLSYGFHVGASYRYTKVPASLILGGYDRSHSSSSALTVPLNSDHNRALTVGLQSIVVTDSLNGTLALLSTEQALFPIDSSVPELWLPRSVCDRFADAFGLQYDEASERYALTDTTRDELRQLSPKLTITIGNSATAGNTTLIQFPYSAFDLQASFPIFENATNYFPIRRADNESQYRLGRAFLQEVYLSVDHERNVFNLSQMNFSSPMPKSDIVTIHPNDEESDQIGASQSRRSLSGGEVAGIVIGCIVILSLLAIVGYRLMKRRNQKNPMPTVEDNQEASAEEKSSPLSAEVMGGELLELPSIHGRSELLGMKDPSPTRHECIYEMPANTLVLESSERAANSSPP